ncbi:MAG: M23 family metallopeptidase [Anaerolineae bacterium]|nr:M23 family metallopeptidase [Anaerolineae bacterium]
MEQGKRRRLAALLVAVFGLAGLCLLAAASFFPLRSRLPFSAVTFPPRPSYAPWPTPPVAEAFSAPLLPIQEYGPYIQGVTGPLAVDTRYDVQNPAMGNHANCFRDARGNRLPFSQLYHAGVDLFAVNQQGQVVWGQAARQPVYAVADGVAIAVVDAGSDGFIVITQHLLANSSFVYSVYWHTDQVQVEAGQPVRRGQVIALVHDLGLNSHLHWEMRTFGDGSALFPVGTAGARGTCNGHFAAVGYTWDDDPERARPGYYGYLDPLAFVRDFGGLIDESD